MARQVQSENGKPVCRNQRGNPHRVAPGLYEAVVPSVMPPRKQSPQSTGVPTGGSRKDAAAKANKIASSFAGPLMSKASQGLMKVRVEKILDPPPAWVAKDARSGRLGG